MIKILHLVSSLSIKSGVMSVIMNYYRNIDKNKVQFDFCYFMDGEDTYEAEINSLGGHTIKISRPSLSIKFFNEINGFFEKQKGIYTALHIHEIYLTFIFATIAKKNGIKNVITHCHATQYSDKKINALRNRILCIPLKKQANYYFSCSKAAGSFLYGEKYLKTEKVKIINNAIDCEKYKFDPNIRSVMRKKLGIEKNLVIGHIGRFNKQKNHSFLIDLFYLIQKKEKNAKLLLVGDGPLFQTIQEKVKKLNLNNNVIFLGRRKDIPDILQAMDIFLLPSLFEGLPVVGVEAQASGLPVVFSNSITQEICLFNYKYLDLNQSPEYWAQEVLSIDRNCNRIQAFLNVKEKGFDIKEEAKKLENIYLEMDI
ncbi:glycosyltransferase family 1 protein [Defluviitalea raffinosedens]|uniref:glycosyltransferase family 1 protein n=1 Tax=Defluviitalea raffinosedens TaxID=1450156 RepID=UPI001958072F|nr:glycosyltransferase family 1 protein [Defluviitalea raffinosedens]MBM7685771.1 glycosyltransferase involved in cell wall biosynthesis [Defluviitalea raffinosedens]